MPHYPTRSTAAPDSVTLLGVDFSWAPLAERERLSYSARDAALLLARARDLDGLHEAVVLSTCNRTEFYVVGDAHAPEALLALVRAERPGASPHAQSQLRLVSGDEAVRHLFEVASGVASLLLGDAMIVRQMKAALAVAASAGTLGPVLSRAFQQAFETGRLARATTDIGRGEASLGAVVASTIAHAGRGPRIVIVGAGTTAKDIARQVAKRAVGSLTIVNRTPGPATALARTCAARTAPWHDLEAEVRAADVVVCATAASVPIIRAEMLGTRRPFLIDVGVPRNIEPPPDAVCLVVDELSAKQDQARARREAAVPAVHALVSQAVLNWQQWLRARPCEALLKEVFVREVEIRQQLVADLVAHGWHGSADAAERIVTRWTGGLLKRHAAELRHWASHTRLHAAGAGEVSKTA